MRSGSVTARPDADGAVVDSEQDALWLAGHRNRSSPPALIRSTSFLTSASPWRVVTSVALPLWTMTRSLTPSVPIRWSGSDDDDAVLRAHARVERLDGVAVGVLRVVPLEREPGADVVPAVGRVHHGDAAGLRGLLHHGVVDADLLRLPYSSRKTSCAAACPRRRRSAWRRRADRACAPASSPRIVAGFQTKMPLFQKYSPEATNCLRRRGVRLLLELEHAARAASPAACRPLRRGGCSRSRSRGRSARCRR